MAAPVKYTVFISSTHDDLQDEREQVTDAILKLGHIPCGMEQFPDVEGAGLVDRGQDEGVLQGMRQPHQDGVPPLCLR